MFWFLAFDFQTNPIHADHLRAFPIAENHLISQISSFVSICNRARSVGSMIFGKEQTRNRKKKKPKTLKKMNRICILSLLLHESHTTVYMYLSSFKLNFM